MAMVVGVCRITLRLPENASLKGKRQVVKSLTTRLRNKLAYSNVAYSLLPQEFSLSQLQQSYEAILGRGLDKRNFRKRITSLGIVEATGRYESEGRHRPAQLYRFVERRPVVI